MNKKEAAQILTTLKASFPMAYKDLSTADRTALVSLWERQFKDQSFEYVDQAINEFISQDTKGWPPAPGQVKEIMAMMMCPELKVNAHTAYQDVLNAISAEGNDRYALDRLDGITRKTAEAIGMKRLRYDTNTNFVERDFCSVFKRLQECEVDQIKTTGVPSFVLENQEQINLQLQSQQTAMIEDKTKKPTDDIGEPRKRPQSKPVRLGEVFDVKNATEEERRAHFRKMTGFNGKDFGKVKK